MTESLTASARLVAAGMRGDYDLPTALDWLRAALERHETRDGYAETCWSVDDVLDVRPDFTEEQAREFLERRAGLILDAMVEAGWAAIETLLEEEDEADRS
ncbi:MAG: hypothetical protein AB7G21_10900 [Dehalococcoidia bacterium]